jgi:succinate dehydrogenase / fumarate reductase, cytochrome b subunit
MGNIFSASIGRKLIMSISGLFLVIFLLVHLTVNLFMLIGADAYNIAAHFMVSNPVIKIMEPLLAIGFVVHIIYASILTLQNQKARPEKYSDRNAANSSSWQSRNMYILGATVLTFMVIHIINFYLKIKFGGEGAPEEVLIDGVHMHDTYSLVVAKFEIWWYVVIYITGAILLGLHLSHGFWSAFQSIGMSNGPWRTRLSVIGKVYAIVIAGGFAIIPLYFLLF